MDKLVKLVLYFWLVVKMYRLAKKTIGKPNVIHAHILLRTAVAARLIQVSEGVPYVLLEHASVFIRTEVKAFNPFTLRIAKYVVKKAAHVITVSECLAKGMREKYGLQNKSYEVIYNCVDTEVFNEKEPLPQRTVKELLYVAEFDNSSKNITGLLEAVASLYGKRKDFRLTVVGYGKDESMLLELSNQLNILNTAIFFTGKLSSREVAAHIKQSDALLMFSNFETLSCIITESLCCGTPVISTAVGGIVEIIKPENGLLVPRADQLAMQLAIEKLLDHQVTFDKHSISRHARALFSNQSVGQKIVSVYKQVSVC